MPPLYEVPGQQPHEADDNRDVQFGLETLATLREHLRSLQVGAGGLGRQCIAYSSAAAAAAVWRSLTLQHRVLDSLRCMLYFYDWPSVLLVRCLQVVLA